MARIPELDAQPTPCSRTAASALRLLAVPSSLRSSAAAQRDRWAPENTTEVIVEIDTTKVDEAVLAVLSLTLHDRTVAWKTIDWDVMRRLHQRGLITDPVGPQKSVVFTDEGLREAQRCFKKLFARSEAR